jgi:uncharacterized membrane protein YkgB
VSPPGDENSRQEITMTAVTPNSPRATTTPPGSRFDLVLGRLGGWVDALEGGHARRYGLVLILLWIGGMKFTAVEAQAIRPFVENSPLLAWTYPAFGVPGLSNLLGVTEIVVALLIATRPWLPRASAVGSLLAVGMFLTTLSFLATTPGAWAEEIGGFPAIGVTGQFLIKDVALLATAVWSFGEAVRATRLTATR